MAVLNTNLVYDLTQFNPIPNLNHHYLKIGVQAWLDNGSLLPNSQILMHVEAGALTASQPPNLSNFYHVNTDDMDAAFYLQHAVYTLYYAYNNSGTWLMTKQIIDMNALLQSLPYKPTTKSPIVTARDTASGTAFYHVKGVAEPNAQIRLYEKSAWEDSLGSTTTFTYGGNTYNNNTVNRTYRPIPASSNFADASGNFDLSINGIGYSTAPYQGIYLCSAQAPGKGESFMNEQVQINLTTTAYPTSRQMKPIETATTATQIAVNGTTQVKYTWVMKVVAPATTSGGTGTETTPTQTDFKWSLTNNGADWAALTVDMWLEAGKINTIYFQDLNSGTGSNTHVTYNVDVPAVGVVTSQTAYTSHTDAIARGFSSSYAHTNRNMYSTFNIGDKIWFSNAIGDCTGPIDGYYPVFSQGISIRVVGGIITEKQNATF